MGLLPKFLKTNTNRSMGRNYPCPDPNGVHPVSKLYSVFVPISLQIGPECLVLVNSQTERK